MPRVIDQQPSFRLAGHESPVLEGPGPAAHAPSVSVVINTYNRASSLRLTLDGLSQLDYPNFGVVVVNGPSTDDTEEVLAGYAGRIRTARCPERNLSMSRNIGISLAAGQIVAFIDDDAYPDPAWLDRLVEAYVDDEVAGAGGPVLDHTGARFQTRYIISDRVGQSTLTFGTNPSEWLNVPGAASFPSLLGTNSSFRRDRLLEIGGFDEEFEYFLDETDVCARLVDAGYVIRQLDDGLVHHRLLPSDIRGDTRVARDRFAVAKNTCYFALKSAREGSSFYHICLGLAEFVENQRRDIALNIEHGLLAPEDLDNFEADVPLAFATGWQHFLAGPSKTRPQEWFNRLQEPFLPFPILRRRQDKLHICLVSQDYPPRPAAGIGRFVQALAEGLARAGHVVRVVTKGENHPRVDLEDGVWVHRIVPVTHPVPASLDAPQHIWDHAASVLDELRGINDSRPIDVVQVPNWDAEGLAVIHHGGFRCVVGIYTPMKTVQRIDPRLAADPVADQIAECERYCYQHADALLADSEAVIAEIEAEYGIRLPTDRLEVIHPGLPDRAGRRATAPSALPGDLTILFVGRLEKRKGIDVLLACLPTVLDQCPGVSVVLAGRDDLPAVGGRSYRGAFEVSAAGRRLAGRVRFLGTVPDEHLIPLYADCDIVVVPSRYESFGLILLEAMMFAKPVVGCAVGGMGEIVEHGASGLLVPSDDAEALGRALVELCRSQELRERLGRRGRALYEERFTVGPMVGRANQFYDRLAGRRTEMIGRG
ncbi:MAG: glycosyltransferase [Actinomycetota bacterium]|nr:glycosyltransferase [Actinomycetota bacterium]